MTRDQSIEKLIAENIDKENQLVVFRAIMVTLLKFMTLYPDKAINSVALTAIKQLRRRLPSGTPSVDMDS